MSIQKVSAHFPYTGSPLGLITSFSEFDYGTSSSGKQSILTSYQSNGQKMLLKSNRSGINGALSTTPHSNEVYDVSTKNIIDKLKGFEHLQLNYADFAYLKNFGVYPNNRLMIARRFGSPVVDDLYSIDTTSRYKLPLSTVVGYNKEEDDFIKLRFNEEWEDAEVSFKSLLNDLGGDFGMKGQFQLGNILEGGANVLPLPGATLLLQRKIMKQLGIISDEDAAIIPQGDPNLIKESLNRKLIKEDDGGSGLKCKVAITLKTTYEQKFINGVDPTIVFMDILNNALNMGTSPATFYLGKQNDSTNSVSKFLKNLTDDPFGMIKKFIISIIDAFKEQLNKIDKMMKKSTKDVAKTDDKGNMAEETSKLIEDGINSTKSYVKNFIKNKYKVKFLGIINALTGGPSTPWHITIGNPLRPIFCSGDMLCKSVNVNMGSQLSFNDLPTFIEVEVELESARNLGLQEIFAKFNSGGIRTLSGTASVGDYIAGIADSFWNSEENYSISNNTTVISTKTTQQSQSTDNTNKTDNTTSSTLSNTTKVTPPTSSITPSTTPNLEVSTDPRATDPVTPAGSNSATDDIRKQSAQDMTGSTEGYTNQIQDPKNTPNSGTTANTITDGPPPTTWQQGKVLSTGSLSYSNGNTYDYTITKDKGYGQYQAYVTASDGTSYSFYSKSKKGAQDYMQSELDKTNSTK